MTPLFCVKIRSKEDMKSLNWLLDDILLEILLMKKKILCALLLLIIPIWREGGGRWYLKLKLLCFTKAVKL